MGGERFSKDQLPADVCTTRYIATGGRRGRDIEMGGREGSAGTAGTGSTGGSRGRLCCGGICSGHECVCSS